MSRKRRCKGLGFTISISIGFILFLLIASCNFFGGGGFIKKYVCQTTAADEDFVDFGSMGSFTDSSDWSVIEKVKLPSVFSTPDRWHVFRGKAWEDKTGDLALRLDEDQVYGWIYSGGWSDVNFDTTILRDEWYTICMQYDASETTLELYVNGELKDSNLAVAAQDDSANSNKLFFGGQDLAPAHPEGDLYHEADIVIAHHAWFQRLLSIEEIGNYDGTLSSLDTTDLFFATDINDSGITDASGNGHHGTIGNTPAFYLDDM